MKIKYLFMLGIAAGLASCSTAYRSGQTPDDVYYSPGAISQKNTYASRSSDNSYVTPSDNSYVTPLSNSDLNSYAYRNDEDYAIRQGISNPIYRTPISLSVGMGYSYNPYALSPYYPMDLYGYGYNPYGMKGIYSPYYSPFYNDLSFYSPYSYYNLYSPYSFGLSPYYSNYYSPIFYSSKTVNTNTGARKYNLAPYNNRTAVQPAQQPIRNTQTGTVRPSRGTGVGNVLRRVFTPQESNNNYVAPRNSERTYNTRSYENNQVNQTPQRTFNNNNYNNTPSPSVSTPAPSSSSSSAPVRTFGR